MKIIKHGKYYERENNITECSNCGCKFQYDKDDEIYMKRQGIYDLYCGYVKFDCVFVKCPECGYTFIAYEKKVETE